MKKGGLIFFPLFISIAAIVFLSLTAHVVLVKLMMAQAIEMTEASNRHNLEHLRDQADQVFSELDRVCLALALHPGVNSILRINDFPRGSSLYYSLYEVQQQLPRYDLANDFIDELSIIYRDNHVVLSSSGSHLDSQNLFIRQLFPQPEREAAYERLWEEEHSGELMKTPSGVYYLRSFPVDSRSSRGLVCIRIRQTAVHDLFSLIDLSSDGVLILKSRGRELFRSGNVPIEGQFFIREELPSRLGLWTLSSSYPISIIREALAPLRRNILFCILGIVFLTLLLSSLLLIWNSKPLLQLLRRLHQEDEVIQAGVKNGYKQLSRDVDRVLSERLQLRGIVDKQKASLKQNSIGNIIRGEFSDRYEAAVLAEQAGLFPYRRELAVCIVKLDSDHKRYEQQQELLIHFSTSVNAANGTELLSYQIQKTAFCCLMDTEGIGEAEDFLRKTFLSLSGLSGEANTALYYGGCAANAEEVHSAFGRAEELFLYYAQEPRAFYSYGRAQERRIRLFYSLEQEIKLITYIRSGNAGRAEQLLLQIDREFFDDHGVSDRARAQLIRQLRGTLFRLSIPCDIRLEEPRQLFDEYQRLFLTRAEENARRSRIRNDQRKERIRSFMYEHYSDPAFTLLHLAQELDKSESSCYLLFREDFGRSFASYLEELRIEKSLALLEQGWNVSETARAVGFSTVQTFRRAFKKRMGLTPSLFLAAG